MAAVRCLDHLLAAVGPGFAGDQVETKIVMILPDDVGRADLRSRVAATSRRLKSNSGPAAESAAATPTRSPRSIENGERPTSSRVRENPMPAEPTTPRHRNAADG